MPKKAKSPSRLQVPAQPTTPDPQGQNHFGTAIRSLTRKLNLRYNQVSQRCGVDPSTLSRVLSGQVLAVVPVSALLEHLPENEEDRAELQRCLILDLLAPYTKLSPLLKLACVDAEEAAAAWQRRLESDPALQQSLDAMLNPGERALMAREILLSMGKVFKRWHRYPLPSEREAAVAEE